MGYSLKELVTSDKIECFQDKNLNINLRKSVADTQNERSFSTVLKKSDKYNPFPRMDSGNQESLNKNYESDLIILNEKNSESIYSFN